MCTIRRMADLALEPHLFPESEHFVGTESGCGRERHGGTLPQDVPIGSLIPLNCMGRKCTCSCSIACLSALPYNTLAESSGRLESAAAILAADLVLFPHRAAMRIAMATMPASPPLALEDDPRLFP